MNWHHNCDTLVMEQEWPDKKIWPFYLSAPEMRGKVLFSPWEQRKTLFSQGRQLSCTDLESGLARRPRRAIHPDGNQVCSMARLMRLADLSGEKERSTSDYANAHQSVSFRFSVIQPPARPVLQTPERMSQERDGTNEPSQQSMLKVFENQKYSPPVDFDRWITSHHRMSRKR